MKNTVIALLLITSVLFSQEKKDKKNVFEVLWGNSVKNNISYLPLANHTHELVSKELYAMYYTSLTYKSFEFSVFENSFSDPTVGLFYLREIPIVKRISLSYGGGIVYGYKGNLLISTGLPGFPYKYRKILFGGAISPAAGAKLNIRLTKKISATVLVVPLLVNAYGLTYHF